MPSFTSKLASLALLGNNVNAATAARLTVEGNKFMYNGESVFLSGMNQAWVDYGDDFGNGKTNAQYCALKAQLQKIKDAGGHAVRIWLHVEGDKTPEFDGHGNVIGTDASGSLIAEMKKYVQTAQDMDILVIFCLWNGALMRNQQTKQMLTDDAKLQTYIQKALIPMVEGLKGEPGLGGWEIMNEPEGSLKVGQADSEPCFDTTKLAGSGAGWAGGYLEIKQLQKILNWHADAIHQADPGALVTVGSWSEKADTDQFGYTNYYTDACLKKAGGKEKGTLDFMQTHSYAHGGQWDQHSPMTTKAADWGLDKPIVDGEFDHDQAASSWSGPKMYETVYNNGYAGAWGWQLIESRFAYLLDGVKALKGKPGVDFKFTDHPNIPDTCGSACSDKAPDSQYTCAQQAAWGKCTESWMKGYCCRSCFGCQGCSSAQELDFFLQK